MKPKKPHSLAFQLTFLTLALLGFGLLMIYSASVSEALKDFGDKFYFARLQFKWALVGLVGLIFFSKINLKTLRSIAPALMLGGFILLVLVAIPGVGTKVQGARRWLVLLGFNFQPSELIKIIEVIYLSSWLNSKKVTLGQFIAFLALLAGLILLQPDMGTTIVVSLIAVSMYFLAEYPIQNILVLIASGLIGGLGLILTSPYRASRLQTFLNPATDPLGSSYHIRQILLALGSGGLMGVGIGKSRQKHEYLPESTTDSIFAVVGEELGFIGAIIVIGVLLYLIYLGFKIAAESKDVFQKTLAGGITTWFAIQVILNLTSMVALTPLTGVPLPLISYGGSALITMLAGIGILINIARNNK